MIELVPKAIGSSGRTILRVGGLGPLLDVLNRAIAHDPSIEPIAEQILAPLRALDDLWAEVADVLRNDPLAEQRLRVKLAASGDWLQWLFQRLTGFSPREGEPPAGAPSPVDTGVVDLGSLIVLWIACLKANRTRFSDVNIGLTIPAALTIGGAISDSLIRPGTRSLDDDSLNRVLRGFHDGSNADGRLDPIPLLALGDDPEAHLRWRVLVVLMTAMQSFDDGDLASFGAQRWLAADGAEIVAIERTNDPTTLRVRLISDRALGADEDIVFWDPSTGTVAAGTVQPGDAVTTSIPPGVGASWLGVTGTQMVDHTNTYRQALRNRWSIDVQAGFAATTIADFAAMGVAAPSASVVSAIVPRITALGVPVELIVDITSAPDGRIPTLASHNHLGHPTITSASLVGRPEPGASLPLRWTSEYTDTVTLVLADSAPVELPTSGTHPIELPASGSLQLTLIPSSNGVEGPHRDLHTSVASPIRIDAVHVTQRGSPGPFVPVEGLDVEVHYSPEDAPVDVALIAGTRTEHAKPANGVAVGFVPERAQPIYDELEVRVTSEWDQDTARVPIAWSLPTVSLALVRTAWEGGTAVVEATAHGIHRETEIRIAWANQEIDGTVDPASPRLQVEIPSEDLGNAIAVEALLGPAERPYDTDVLDVDFDDLRSLRVVVIRPWVVLEDSEGLPPRAEVPDAAMLARASGIQVTFVDGLPRVSDALAVVSGPLNGRSDPRALSLGDALRDAIIRTPGGEDAVWVALLPDSAWAGTDMVHRIADPPGALDAAVTNQSSLARYLSEISTPDRTVQTVLRVTGQLDYNRFELLEVREEVRACRPLDEAPSSGSLAWVLLDREDRMIHSVPFSVVDGRRPSLVANLIPLTPATTAVVLRQQTGFLDLVRIERPAAPPAPISGVLEGSSDDAVRTLTWSRASPGARLQVEIRRDGLWTWLRALPPCSTSDELDLAELGTFDALRIVSVDGWYGVIGEIDADRTTDAAPVFRTLRDGRHVALTEQPIRWSFGGELVHTGRVIDAPEIGAVELHDFDGNVLRRLDTPIRLRELRRIP